MTRTTTLRDPQDVKKKNNLGSLQLRHVDSNQIILIPTPTNDPNGKHKSFSCGWADETDYLQILSTGRRVIAGTSSSWCLLPSSSATSLQPVRQWSSPR